ncbi:tetratricopeptide repeat protein [bacterium]|nr:tetratricopeptide repeat protein [bacterium]MBU1615341.1 tetratricopeptide repeat protein [bacterium]
MKRSIFSIIIIGLFLLGCAREGSQFEKKKREWEKEIKKYEKVIQEKIEAYDKLALVYRKLGNELLERGFFNEAADYYQKAIHLLPNEPELHRSLAVCQANRGKTDEKFYDEAITEYQKAINLNPDSAESYYGLGVIYYFEKDEKQKAISSLEKAVRLNPKYIDAHLALGQFYYETGKTQIAIDKYKEAIALHPKKAKITANYYVDIGLIHYHTGNRAAAVSSFRKALEIDKNNREARENLGLLGEEVYDRYKKYRGK